MPRAVSLGCGLTLHLPQGLSRGGLSIFFWLCLVGRSKWAWLNPQVRKGAKPSTSVLSMSCARSCQPPVSWGSVQGFGSSSFPLEVTGICFPANHTCGDHWNLCRCLGTSPPLCRSQGSVCASPASPLEITGICLSRGHRILCFPAKPPLWRSLGSKPPLWEGSVYPQGSNSGTRPSQAAVVEKMLINCKELRSPR